ncbi:mtaD [Symbiodinium sp. KB8]|nr:mtaD [Symbiodinium sp. KB8]
MKLASGFARVADLLAAGVNVAIGTDSCASNNCLDMFSEMKVAANMAKAVSDDPTAVPAPTALKMATLNGAKAMGLDHQVGSLVPGKRADIIAVKLSSIEHRPVYDILSHLVYVGSRER